jgi:hypothetical protein
VTGLAVCTAVRANYLPHARVLAHSLRRHHPELALHVILADEVGGRFDPSDEPFVLSELASLDGRDRRAELAGRDPKEVVVAAKAEAIIHLLATGADTVLFVDADSLVLGDLGPLLGRIRGRAITLVPHHVAPLEGPSAIGDELHQLIGGTFNGGLLAVSDRPAGHAFLSWWRERLRDHCRLATAEGIFYDQRWLDLVPGLFGEVGVQRDAAYDTAYWNVGQRDVGDCRLFHFSGFEPDGPSPVTRWAPELGLDAMGEFAPLFAEYRATLVAQGLREAAGWRYAYARGEGDGSAAEEVARAPASDSR